MWWILLLFPACMALTETPTVLFCLPHILKEWSSEDLTTTTKTCLVENYIHEANNNIFLDDYVHAYQHAWQSHKLAEEEDNRLYHHKRELMMFLRDTKLKAANHMHAVIKCASIGHRMPKVIMDAYTDEAKMMFRVMDIWTHHTRVDLEHCGLLLNNIVAKTHRHAAAHILTLFHKYMKQLHVVEDARESATHAYTDMLQERQTIVNTL